MRIVDVLSCPKCKGDLLPQHAGNMGKTPHGSYKCSQCGSTYPIIGEVLDFLPQNNGRASLAQGLWEFKPVIRIYESRLWRRSHMFTFFLGISLDEEISLIKKITELGPSDTVLDLGCGPGTYSRALAEGEHQRRIIGLDLSWPMLKSAEKRSKVLGFENISFLHGDAHSLPFQDSSLDVVNCSAALHYFPEVDLVLGEISRVLRPGGRFSAGTLLLRDVNPLRWQVAELNERMFRVHGFREEELRGLLDHAGFDPTVYHARRTYMVVGGVKRPA